MTGGQDWSADGLGNTGEVYLAASDLLMRSISRELIEDPERFERDALDAGVSSDGVEQMLRLGDSILLMPVDTEAVRRAVAGATGTVTATEYLGRESLVAYAPLTLDQLPWVVVAKMDRDEALVRRHGLHTDDRAVDRRHHPVCLLGVSAAGSDVRPADPPAARWRAPGRQR